MKRIYTLIAGLMLTASVFAKAPEKMSYQAVIRNASNNLTTNQAVGMQISIVQGGATEIAVYVETQTPTTNANGLVTLEIGTGTVVSGDFTTIDWANDTYFIKTETDPTGGTTYTITGTTQLMSVPYVLHAKTAESITGNVNYTEIDPFYTASEAANITAAHITTLGNTSGTNTGDQTVITAAQATAITANTAKVGVTTAQATTLSNTSGTNTGDQDGSETKVTAGTNVTVTGTGTTSSPYVVNATSGGSTAPFYLGQDTLGGIVYYIYKDATGTQHGLIVNKNESTSVWQATGTLTNADRSEDGAFNTALMTNSAAATYVTGLGAGWYLPSIDELGLLYYNRFSANRALRAGGFTLLSITATYWSSTEFNSTNAYYFRFHYGFGYYLYNKNFTFSVRAVRAF